MLCRWVSHTSSHSGCAHVGQDFEILLVLGNLAYGRPTGDCATQVRAEKYSYRSDLKRCVVG